MVNKKIIFQIIPGTDVSLVDDSSRIIVQNGQNQYVFNNTLKQITYTSLSPDDSGRAFIFFGSECLDISNMNTQAFDIIVLNKISESSFEVELSDHPLIQMMISSNGDTTEIKACEQYKDDQVVKVKINSDNLLTFGNAEQTTDENNTKPDVVVTTTDENNTKPDVVVTTTDENNTKPDVVVTTTDENNTKPDVVVTTTDENNTKPDVVVTTTDENNTKPDVVVTTTDENNTKPDVVVTTTDENNTKPDVVVTTTDETTNTCSCTEKPVTQPIIEDCSTLKPEDLIKRERVEFNQKISTYEVRLFECSNNVETIKGVCNQLTLSNSVIQGEKAEMIEKTKELERKISELEITKADLNKQLNDAVTSAITKESSIAFLTSVNSVFEDTNRRLTLKVEESKKEVERLTKDKEALVTLNQSNSNSMQAISSMVRQMIESNTFSGQATPALDTSTNGQPGSNSSNILK